MPTFLPQTSAFLEGGLSFLTGQEQDRSAVPVAAAATSALIAKAFAACIDGNAWIEMRHGRKQLKDVVAGDRVRAIDGGFTEVVGKDFGLPHVARSGDYVEIVTDRRRITLTLDHHILAWPAKAWRPAREWKVGDFLVPERIRKIRPVGAVPSGDLELADDHLSYIANGFPVRSMFSIYKIESPQFSSYLLRRFGITEPGFERIRQEEGVDRTTLLQRLGQIRRQEEVQQV